MYRTFDGLLSGVPLCPNLQEEIYFLRTRCNSLGKGMDASSSPLFLAFPFLIGFRFRFRLASSRLGFSVYFLCLFYICIFLHLRDFFLFSSTYTSVLSASSESVLCRTVGSLGNQFITDSRPIKQSIEHSSLRAIVWNQGVLRNNSKQNYVRER